MRSHYYEWRHGQVHYVKRGMGDPLVLVHGIYPGASADEFEHNIAALQKHYTVHAIDLLGFGLSAAPRMKLTSQTYVGLISDFLRDVVDTPATVVTAGASCAYATHVAAWRPWLIDRLVFIQPESKPVDPDEIRPLTAIRHFIMSTPPTSWGLFETLNTTSSLQSFVRSRLYNPRLVSLDHVERMHDLATLPDSVYAFASYMLGYLSSDLFKPLPNVTTPILQVVGQHADEATREVAQRLRVEARHIETHVIGRARNWPHVEQSRLSNDAILTGLSRTEGVHAPVASAS